MGTLNISWTEIKGLGYYEALRLQDIATEYRAGTEENLALLFDRPHAERTYRDGITNWIKRRQPRRNPSHGVVPKEILARLSKVFNG